MGLTGLLPIILFPLFQIASIEDLAPNYVEVCHVNFSDHCCIFDNFSLQNIHLLIIGTMMIAAAIEKHNLHKRAALRVLLLIGTSPRRSAINHSAQ
jgi:sodium-dependent dicarboxylate transporter 2/3/5